MMSQTPSTQTNAHERRINIVQGEHRVSEDPCVVLSTLLGSCVSACIRDPAVGVGGLNHFLLPAKASSAKDGTALRHGAHPIELLVNALLRHGARRNRLEAKLFGGANLMRGLTDVGAMNAAFAEDFLRREGISNMGGSLRGDRGRRIQYWPATGRVRQVLMAPDEQVASAIERRSRPLLQSASAGAVELF